MTEQDKIIEDFKDECRKIITKYASGKTQNIAFEDGAKKEITDLADETVNRHSNMPNIDTAQLKEELYSAAKTMTEE